RSHSRVTLFPYTTLFRSAHVFGDNSNMLHPGAMRTCRGKALRAPSCARPLRLRRRRASKRPWWNKARSPAASGGSSRSSSTDELDREEHTSELQSLAYLV